MGCGASKSDAYAPSLDPLSPGLSKEEAQKRLEELDGNPLLGSREGGASSPSLKEGEKVPDKVWAAELFKVKKEVKRLEEEVALRDESMGTYKEQIELLTKKLEEITSDEDHKMAALRWRKTCVEMEPGERLMAACGRYSWLGTTTGKLSAALTLRNDLSWELLHATPTGEHLWNGKFQIGEASVGDDPSAAKGHVYPYQDKAVGLALSCASVSVKSGNKQTAPMTVALLGICWVYPSGHAVMSPLYRESEFEAAVDQGLENPAAMSGGYVPQVGTVGQPPASPPGLFMALSDIANSALLTGGKFMQSSQKLKANASLAKATKAIKRQEVLSQKLSRALHGRALFVFEVVLSGGDNGGDEDKVMRKVKAVEVHVRNIKMEGLLWGPTRQVNGGEDVHKVHVPCTMEGKLFELLDLDNDGKMDSEEFARACRDGGIVTDVKAKMAECEQVESVDVIVQQL